MPKRNQHKDVQRFTADEIVRAIDAVTKAGLTVYSVEITNSGSIKIETQPSQQHSSKAKTSPVNANVQPEIQKKKQAGQVGDDLRGVFIALAILIVIFFLVYEVLVARGSL